MGKLVCVSACSREAVENLNKTIFNNIPIKTLLPLLSKDQCEVFSSYNNGIYAWASRESKRNQILWSKLNVGDVVLFYSDRKFVAYGEIHSLSDNAKISRALWQDGRFRLIFFLINVRKINIDRTKFWDIFGYSPKAKIQGLRIPKLELQSEIFDQEKSLYEQIPSLLA